MRTFFQGSSVAHPSAALLLSLSALLVFSSADVVAQTFASATDQPIPRRCTNQCPQNSQKIAVDNGGNAIAIWTEQNGSASNIVTSRFNGVTGRWSTPQSLQGETGTQPDVGIDGSGNAIAVWRQDLNETDKVMRFSRYIAAQGIWTRPSNAFANFNRLMLSNLSVGKNGDAFIFTGDGEDFNYLSVYNAVTKTWQRVGMGGGFYREVRVATDGAGNAMVASLVTGPRGLGNLAVQRYDGQANSFNIEYGRIELENAYDTPDNEGWGNIEVAMDRFGNAMATWNRSRSDTYTTPTSIKTVTSYALKSARYRTSTRTWSTKSVPMLSNGKIMSAASVVGDRAANVHAVWTQYIGMYAKTMASRYSSTTGIWSTPRVIQSGNYNTREAKVAVDTNGNAFATWSQRSDSGTGLATNAIHRTTAVRYSITAGTWGSPRIVQDVNRNSYLSELGVDGQGRAIVMWPQDSSTFGVKELRSDRLLPQ